MGALEDLEEINRLLTMQGVKMDIKDIVRSEESEILIVDTIEFEEADVPPPEEAGLQELTAEDIAYLRSQFRDLVAMLESAVAE